MIEVVGVSTQNKGAELMLVAIKEHFEKTSPGTAIVVPKGFGRYEDRAQYKLRTKLSSKGIGRTAIFGKFLPKTSRQAYGLALESDITAVIDASGFAFGDQHPEKRTIDFAAAVRRWKRQGKPVVMLPQALGPFANKSIRHAFIDIVKNVDIIYARDGVSYQHVAELGRADNLRLAPDFTNLLTGKVPSDFTIGTKRACIVPNHRMVEKTTAAEREQYLPFLARCVEQLSKMGCDPFLLLHDTGVDETLVEPLQALLPARIEVVRASDPLHLKGILGKATVVVASRFHALVSALSQGVPCIATGWSHKYEMLFTDYGCPDCVVNLQRGAEEIAGLLDRMVNEPARSALVQTLVSRSEEQKNKVKEMWREVDKVLGLQGS